MSDTTITVRITAEDALRLEAVAGERSLAEVAADILHDVLEDDARAHAAARPWSKGDDRTLKALRQLKVSPSSIATSVGRTVQEVRARLQEIGA